jgi:hypothetical protein
MSIQSDLLISQHGAPIVALVVKRSMRVRAVSQVRALEQPIRPFSSQVGKALEFSLRSIVSPRTFDARSGNGEGEGCRGERGCLGVVGKGSSELGMGE